METLMQELSQALSVARSKVPGVPKTQCGPNIPIDDELTYLHYEVADMKRFHSKCPEVIECERLLRRAIQFIP